MAVSYAQMRRGSHTCRRIKGYQFPHLLQESHFGLSSMLHSFYPNFVYLGQSWLDLSISDRHVCFSWQLGGNDSQTSVYWL